MVACGSEHWTLSRSSWAGVEPARQWVGAVVNTHATWAAFGPGKKRREGHAAAVAAAVVTAVGLAADTSAVEVASAAGSIAAEGCGTAACWLGKEEGTIAAGRVDTGASWGPWAGHSNADMRRVGSSEAAADHTAGHHAGADERTAAAAAHIAYWGSWSRVVGRAYCRWRNMGSRVDGVFQDDQMTNTLELVIVSTSC